MSKAFLENTMRWRLPSLTALRTFEAAARHLSFTKAAAELHLTQSAVSHQIRGMENGLGVRLFERVRQRLVLTEVGRNYVEEVRLALERMQAATLNLLASRGQGGVLNLATKPAFGMKWLIPRLGAFSTAHPEILVNLVTRSHTPFDFAIEPIDAAIHYGLDDWHGTIAEPIDDGEEVPVCAPGYPSRARPLRKLRDLDRSVLLQHTGKPNAWQDWLEAVGVKGVNAWAGPRYEHFYMIVQAAVAGMGVGLLPRLLVDDDVAAGRLVIPFQRPYISREAYYFVYPKNRENDPRVAVFRKWLLAETGKRPQVTRRSPRRLSQAEAVESVKSPRSKANP